MHAHLLHRGRIFRQLGRELRQQQFVRFDSLRRRTAEHSRRIAGIAFDDLQAIARDTRNRRQVGERGVQRRARSHNALHTLTHAVDILRKLIQSENFALETIPQRSGIGKVLVQLTDTVRNFADNRIAVARNVEGIVECVITHSRGLKVWIISLRGSTDVRFPTNTPAETSSPTRPSTGFRGRRGNSPVSRRTLSLSPVRRSCPKFGTPLQVF